MHLHGGISSRAGTRLVATFLDSTVKSRAIGFSFNTEQTYLIELGDQTISFYKDGGQILTQKAITNITQANPAVVTITGHGAFSGDTIDLAAIGGMTELNGTSPEINVLGANTFELVGVDSTGYGAYTSGGTGDYPYRITSPYVEADLFKLRYTQSADTMTITSDQYAARELTRTAHDAWTLTSVTYGTTLAAPTGLVPTGTAGGITYTYKVTALTALGEESLPSAAASFASAALSETTPITLNWNVVSGATRYLVYRYRGGAYGFIGSAETNVFVDDNINPDLTDAPPETNNPFSGDNPKAVAYYQQRLAYAGLANNPQNLEISKIRAYKNFNLSFPAKDNDAFGVQINSKQVNAVEHLVSSEDLLAFTSGAVWSLSSGDLGFSFPNIKATKRNNYGAADTPPLEASDSVLFVTRSGKGVQELLHLTQGDQPSYANKDLLALANHLTKDYSITDWAYAQIPDSIIWAVRADGALLGLTYVRDQEVWAWHRHDTDGFFESVAVVEESGVSAVYVTVKRTIDGVETRFIERFAEREYTDIEKVVATDCSVSYSGSPLSTIPGFDHLIGETVSGLADGNVIVPQEIAAGGNLVLEFPASEVSVGLPYTCEIEGLRSSLNSKEVGSTFPVLKSTTDVSLQVDFTRGIFVGTNGKEETLNEYKARTDEVETTPVTPASGLITVNVGADWTTEATVYIKLTDPLPMTILSIIPSVEFSDG